MKQNKPKYNLDNLSRKTPFQVENGYFEKLPYQIQDKVYQQKRTSFWKSNIFKWSTLAMSLGILIIGFFIYQQPTTTSFDINAEMAKISTENIEEYLRSYDAIEEEENEIIQLVIENKYHPQIEDFMAFSEEDIEAYLDENYATEDIENLDFEDYETIID